MRPLFAVALVCSFAFAQDNETINSRTEASAENPQNTSQWIEPEEDFIANGFLLAGQQRTYLYKSLAVASGSLRRPETYETLILTQGTRIYFYPNGQIQKAFFSEPTEFRGMNLNPMSVEFYQDGTLKKARLAEGQSLGKGQLEVSTALEVSFDEEGRPTKFYSHTGKEFTALGYNFYDSATFSYNEKTEKYLLLGGRFEDPHLIAHLQKRMEFNGGTPGNGLEPVIAPKRSFFYFRRNHPDQLSYQGQAEPADQWTITSGNFRLNNLDLGYNPSFLIKSGRIIEMTLNKTLEVDGIKYPQNKPIRLLTDGTIMSR